MAVSASATGRPSRSGRSAAGCQRSEPSRGAVIRCGWVAGGWTCLRSSGTPDGRRSRGWPDPPGRRPGSGCRGGAAARQDGAMIGRLHSVVIDAPDPHALATFYAGLLGMEIKGAPGDEWVVTTGAGYRLAFQEAPDLIPPDWPD